MSVEFEINREDKKSSLSEFAGAFYDASAGRLIGVIKSSDNKTESPSPASTASKAGRLAGEVFDVLVAAAVAGKVAKVFSGAQKLEHLAITEANNPVSHLNRKLPEFFNSLDANEALIKGTKDSGIQRGLLKEQINLKADFAYDLMKLWHGADGVPGIAKLSDTALATSEISVQRVAQLRAALKTPAPEMSETLFKIARPAGEYDDQLHNLSAGMLSARERYHNYDLYEVSGRMSMPDVHSQRDHFDGTPVTWMPTPESSGAPGFYHGTISSSLDSIIAEKSIIPSNELRARGIRQTAGETAASERGKDEVSITRDFNEAWAYQIQNPQYIDAYPIVFGISRQAAKDARVAGFLEPGEILIDKLHMGPSTSERSGAITHMYVPDGKVAEVINKLARGRVRGVSVTGLGDLKAPQWTHEVPLSELELY